MFRDQVVDDCADDLLPGPEQLRLLYGGREQLYPAGEIHQSSEHELLIFSAGEEAAAHRHLDRGDHVVLDSAVKRSIGSTTGCTITLLVESAY